MSVYPSATHKPKRYTLNSCTAALVCRWGGGSSRQASLEAISARLASAERQLASLEALVARATNIKGDAAEDAKR